MFCNSLFLRIPIYQWLQACFCRYAVPLVVATEEYNAPRILAIPEDAEPQGLFPV